MFEFGDIYGGHTYSMKYPKYAKGLLTHMRTNNIDPGLP
jgi:hypothetical protein